MNKPSSVSIYVACALILSALNIWSLTVVRRLYQEQEVQVPGVKVSALPRLKLVSFQDGRKHLADLGSKDQVVLLYVFSPFDCPEAIEELKELDNLHRERPQIDIRAIALYESQDEAQQTRQRFQLSYPVLSDSSARVKVLLTPPQTPWKVLYNSTTARAMLEDGPSITPEEKISFRRHVEYLVPHPSIR